MKILYVTTISNTVNAFLIPHIAHLVKKGHDVHVAFNQVAKVDSKLKNMGVKIHNIPFQRTPLKKDNIDAYKIIKKIIKYEEYDLIHTHTPVASFITRFASRNIKGIKTIYTAHGFHFYKGAPLRNWLLYFGIEKLTARWTDGIITINNEDYITAKRKLVLRKENSIFQIPGVGVNLVDFSKAPIELKNNLRIKYKLNQSDFILFYAAELNENKNQEIIIRAVYLLKNKIPNLKLLLAGAGNLREKYEELINQLDLHEYVYLLGKRDDIPDLLRVSDVAVASSKREGLPVNVLEAMATGLPIIVTNCRGHRDLVKDGENGIVVGVNDVGMFANAIYQLYNSVEIREVFGLKNLEEVNNYTIENVINKLNYVYSKI